MKSIALALVVALPRLALACPQCAGNDKGGIFAGVLIGSMIVLPFIVAGAVYRVIRKDLRE
jgi:hypothetical protein